MPTPLTYEATNEGAILNEGLLYDNGTNTYGYAWTYPFSEGKTQYEVFVYGYNGQYVGVNDGGDPGNGGTSDTQNNPGITLFTGSGVFTVSGIASGTLVPIGGPISSSGQHVRFLYDKPLGTMEVFVDDVSMGVVVIAPFSDPRVYVSSGNSGYNTPAPLTGEVVTEKTVVLTPEDKVVIDTGDLLTAESKVDIVTGDLLGAEAKSDIVTGDLLPAESKADIVTGALLTAIPLPPTSGFPLNYARIGYDNALVNGAASATSDSVNSAKMLTPSTYDKWRPTADSVATLVGTLKQCDYVGIAAHNLGTDGVTLTVKVSDGGAYTTVYSQLVTTDNALFIRFAEGSYSNVELTLTGSLTAEIGVVFLGLELEMMRPTFSGHRPVNLNATDVMTPQVSDGGQFLGKQIVRQGYATSADFQHLTDEWYRDKFQPFVEHAKVRPYFWAWNLLESPDDVVYGWTNSNIGCSYMGIRNWLQVSFDVEAHA